MSNLHNQIKYGTEILRGFSRYVGLGEEEEGTVRLGETLQPILDAWSIPELAFLRGDRLWAVRQNVAAGGAGTNAGVAIVNPPTSRSIVIIEHVSGEGGAAAQQMSLYLHAEAVLTSDLGTSGNVNARDRRLPVAFGVPVMRSGTPAVISTGQQIEVIRNAAFTTVSWQSLPIVLPPGQGAALWQETEAAAMSANFSGRVHRLQPGELGT